MNILILVFASQPFLAASVKLVAPFLIDTCLPVCVVLGGSLGFPQVHHACTHSTHKDLFYTWY